jgi:hypothetical protein
VRPERFELPAFWFVARRSIQLSYGRTVFSTTCDLPRFDRPPICGNYYNENSDPRRRHCSSFAALSANFCGGMRYNSNVNEQGVPHASVLRVGV